jgi:hypothetical protein
MGAGGEVILELMVSALGDGISELTTHGSGIERIEKFLAAC